MHVSAHTKTCNLPQPKQPVNTFFSFFSIFLISPPRYAWSGKDVRNLAASPVTAARPRHFGRRGAVYQDFDCCQTCPGPSPGAPKRNARHRRQNDAAIVCGGGDDQTFWLRRSTCSSSKTAPRRALRCIFAQFEGRKDLGVACPGRT